VGTVPPDDYYALLGIAPGADAGELRRAWRRLALRWHPDRAGPGATPMFQRLHAAYTVLADPTARAVYDEQPGGRVVAPAPRRRAPGVMLRRQSGPLDALLAGGVARHAEGGLIELQLNADEAASGGMVTISMRVPVHCPACVTHPTRPCDRCDGRRTVDELYSAWLAVPPGVTDGTVLTPSARLRGMVQPVSFRVCVDPAA